MSQIHELVGPITDWLHSNPSWSGLITFLISFSESLAIIGSIVPGSVTMTAIGILAGSGVIPLYSTFGFAILGAVAGDSASYWLGYYFKERLIKIWPFSKNPDLLKNGRHFFDVHGGKSVFIGRFLGPLRAVVPVVAGMLNMKSSTFLIANVTSAILWSFLYVLPGVLIGSASTLFNKEQATYILIFVLIMLTSTWLIIKLSQFLIRKIYAWLRLKAPSIQKILQLKLLKQSLHPILIGNSSKETAQYFGCFVLSLTLFLSFLIWSTIAVHIDGTIHLNHWVRASLSVLHIPLLEIIIPKISIIGNKWIYLIILILVSMFLILKRHYQELCIWLSLNISTFMFVPFFKWIFVSQRPNPLLATGSLPSGHVTLITSIGCYLLYQVLLGRFGSKALKESLLLPFIVAVYGVAFSRLYIDAHWLSDVIAGALLGMALYVLHLIPTLKYIRNR